MEILEKLFGSVAKVKIIKLFLFNPESSFDITQTTSRAKVTVGIARREISDLCKIGFLRPHSYTKETKKQQNRKVIITRKRTNGWTLDRKFPYLEVMDNFLSKVNPFNSKEIVRKISRAGKIQLLVISGIFIKYEDARADLLIVGDNLKTGQLENIIKTIESEMGKEIRYAVFDTAEFNYRLSLFDKLIKDILDFPHKKIVNKLDI